MGYEIINIFFIIPKLTSKNIQLLAFHIIGVTLISIIFLIIGLSFILDIIL